MADVCPRCLMTFPQHIVIRAQCARRWRGHSFDQAAAEGNVGAAVAAVLGIDATRRDKFDAFLQRVFIRAYGFSPAPVEGDHDPSGGEPYEFHVGLRELQPPETFARVEAAARDAVRASRNFQLRD